MFHVFFEDLYLYFLEKYGNVFLVLKHKNEAVGIGYLFSRPHGRHVVDMCGGMLIRGCRARPTQAEHDSDVSVVSHMI